MLLCRLALLFFGAVLLSGCADQANVPAPNVSAAPVHPQIVGNTKSISSADTRTIIDLEHAAILKEFHAFPTSMTVHVINHNHVFIFFDVGGQQCGDPVDRVSGKWRRPDRPRVIVVGSNHALQPTDGRSDA